MLIALFFIFGSSPVFAEFYKYKDANGVLRFTDNIHEVPMDQRPGVSKYTEPDDALTPEQKAAKEQAEKKKQEAEKKETKKKEDEERVALGKYSRDDLNREKDLLDIEHNNLTKAKQALAEERAAVETEEQARAYTKKVDELNKRIATFEERRQLFKRTLEAYEKTRTEE
jgi:hypothetical protein